MEDAATSPENNKKLKGGEYKKVKKILKILLSEPGAIKMRKINVNTKIKKKLKKLKKIINELIPNIYIIIKASL